MSRLYYILRKGLKVALELYFVDIQSSGTEHIPSSGPVIFAANHPNSIMDTMLLGACTSRQVHYMARSGLFKNPAVAWLFDACGVIPVYRAQDGTDMSKNQSSFDRAYETLEAGLCLGIFPEGQNSDERRVQKIKTGAARIALGAAHRRDFELDVKIIPVGINFQDRDRFLTSVLIRFGPPISVLDYVAEHARDERAAVRSLTQEIQQGLEAQVLHIEHDLVLDMSQTIVKISSGELLRTIKRDETNTELKASLRERFKRARGVRKKLLDRFRSVKRAPRLAESFNMQRLLSDALSEELLHRPRAFARRRADLRAYRDHLRQTSLRDDFAVRHPATLSTRKEAIKLTLYAVLVGPIAAWGFLHNVVPYQITYRLAMRAPDEAIRAMTAFVSGMLTFSLWYALLAYILWESSGHRELVTIPYMIFVPFAGFVFLRYRQRVATWRKRILARTLFRTRTNLVEQLVHERDLILSSVHTLLVDYLATQDQPIPEELFSTLQPEQESMSEPQTTSTT